MLEGLLLIIIIGFLLGELSSRLGLPKLIGMFFAGVVMGPYVLDILPEAVLIISDDVRMFALILILFKAGLGLDKDKILSQGTVALRLGFMPAFGEAAIFAIATRYIMGWDWVVSWLLGWIVCAASPAVIVPMMLKLKSEGLGVRKGIPDLILAGGTISDVAAITMFGIFLDLSADGISGGWLSKIVQMPVQIIVGVILGFLAGKLIHLILQRTLLAKGIVHDLIITLSFALLLVLGETIYPYSGFLSIMVMGFTILESNKVLARRVRNELDKAWVLGEILLFVFLGAAVNVRMLFEVGKEGLIILAIGLIIGRTIGIFSATFRSSISMKERGFMVVGQMAKATVQAAIGSIPLAMGVPNGEMILAISALSILVTAPLGAFGIAYLAPKMLEKGEIDLTKVNVNQDYSFLVALDGSKRSEAVLQEAARMARQIDGKLFLLYVVDKDSPRATPFERVGEYAIDIEHQVFKRSGNPAEIILETAEEYEVDFIIIGKSSRISFAQRILGDVFKQVLDNARIPVLVVDKP